MSCTLQTSGLRPHCRPSASCFGTLVNSDIWQEYTVLSSAEINNAKSINAQTIGIRQINDSGLVLSELIRILRVLGMDLFSTVCDKSLTEHIECHR